VSSGLLVRLKAFLAVLFWGASFLPTKIALREVQTATIILLRFALGIAILWQTIWRWRALILGENSMPAILLGGAVILFGIYLVNRSTTKRAVGVSVASD
jgi:drug/metabolite transporter (DMT)-like permease